MFCDTPYQFNIDAHDDILHYSGNDVECKMTYMSVMGELVPLENKLQKRSSEPMVQDVVSPI